MLPEYGRKQKDGRNGCAQRGRAKARWSGHALQRAYAEASEGSRLEECESYAGTDSCNGGLYKGLTDGAGGHVGSRG
jgi:hypothetical protein